MICRRCGRIIGTSYICPFCGEKKYQKEKADLQICRDEDKIEDEFSHKAKSNDIYGNKLRLTAGILQLFCGAFGIGRFYMGYKTYAFLQIAATIVTFGVCGVIWGALDGIAILTGSVMYDGDGRLLK